MEEVSFNREKIAKVAVIGLKISAIGGLVATGIVGGAAMLNKNVNLRLRWMHDVICYGLPEANRRLEDRLDTDPKQLYDAPVNNLYDAPEDDRFE